MNILAKLRTRARDVRAHVKEKKDERTSIKLKVFGVVFLFVAVVIMSVYANDEKHVQKHLVAWGVGFGFMVLTGKQLTFLHLHPNTNPQPRRHPHLEPANC